jgi:lysophospholipase L1-like esterase
MTQQVSQGTNAEKRAAAPAGSRKLSFRKRVLFIVLSNVLALGLLAVVGEIACRVFAPRTAYGTLPDWMLQMLRFSDDIYLGWELRPGQPGHNRFGMRGAETVMAKPQNVWRIAIVGDSVTYGLGVEADETFASLLESRLNETGIGPVEVLNFGVPGYSTFQEYVLLKNRVLRFDPDLVVVTFTPDDVETSPVVINVGGNMCLFRNQFEGFSLLNNPVHWAVFRRSYLYRFLYERAALAVMEPGADFDDVCEAPELQWENVRRMARLCAETQTDFLLVLSPCLLPFDSQEDPRETARIRQWFGQVRQLAKRSRLCVLDLGPLYDRHVGELKIRPGDHEHLNPRGHRLVAAELLRKVLALKPQAGLTADN